jgi:hypothetical protein
MRIPDLRAAALAPLLVVAAGAALAQDAVLSQAAALLADPAPGAAQVAKLPANTPLSVRERKGGWYRVEGPGGEQGWVKLLSVRLAARPGALQEAGDDSGAAGAALGGAASGGAGGAAAGALGSMMTGSAQESTAVRGGSSGKLSGRKVVDPAKAEAGATSSLEQMDGYTPSEADMKAFEQGLEEQPGDGQ